MEPDRWKQIERPYHAAPEREPDARKTFLLQACGGDEELRREVTSLVDYDSGPALFFKSPIPEFAAQSQSEERTAEMFDSLFPIDNRLIIPEAVAFFPPLNLH